MKNFLILFMFLIALSSCIEDDDYDYDQLPSISNIEVYAPEGFQEGSLLEFSIPLLNGLRQDQVDIIWDFGDGSSEYYQNVSHRYDQAGSYEVSVKVSNDLGWDRSTTTITISPEHSDNPYRGSVIFWAKGNQITPPISVSTRSTTGQIARTFIQTPTCGDDGVAQWDDVPYGTYHFSAQDAVGVTWNGRFTVDQDCNGVKLLYSGNGKRSSNSNTIGYYKEIELSLL